MNKKINKIKSKLNKYLRISYILSKQWIEENVIYNRFTTYPTVVNFPITGKCNMKCKMCNVWKKENQHTCEMTPDQIGQVFRQPLFKKVKHVGLSGGEPFARNDIEQVVHQIVKNTPTLKSLSIITNGTLVNKIDEHISKIKEICESNNINFSVAISVDGVEEIHNEVRGNNNSFNNILDSVKMLKEKGVQNLSLCCTITKQNIDYLYQTLEFAKNQNIYIKFRVAVEINRLYNEDLKENYTFTRDEKIKIAKFYDKLYWKYEKKLFQRMYYRSVKENLLEGKARQIGCAWTNKGISLDAEGNLYYCFVKSPKLTSLITGNGWESYKNNIHIREEIKEQHCDSCIHDYVGPIKLSFAFEILKEKINNRLTDYVFNKRYLNKIEKNLPQLLQKKNKINLSKPKKSIFITGWYGTETTGDKAIIAGIYNQITKHNPNAAFVVSSIIPYFTEETVKELGFKNTTVVKRNSQEEKEAIRKSDLVIMGGGPLMHIKETIEVLQAFEEAVENGIPTCVYSCGIGPLHSEKYKQVVRKILQLSCFTYVRDLNSLKAYPDVTEGINITANVDGAVAYLLDFNHHTQYEDNKKILACIRDWPKNYTKFIDKESFEKAKSIFIEKLCEQVKKLTDKGFQVSFFPMNTFYIGDDDRDYYMIIKNELGDYKDKVTFYTDDYTTRESVNIFLEHSAVIGMRFHSVVFGNSLGIPTLGLDYDTNKGKIYGFMKDIQLEENYVAMSEIVEGDVLEDKINRFVENREQIFDKLMEVKKVLAEKIEIPCKEMAILSDTKEEV